MPLTCDSSEKVSKWERRRCREEKAQSCDIAISTIMPLKCGYRGNLKVTPGSRNV
jgi:hypothetical protein